MAAPAPALSDIDIHDPAQYRRGVPHEQLTRLRAEAPVWFQAEPEGAGYWAVTKHADIVHASTNPRIFSSERGGINIPDATEDYLETSKFIMISMDPPKHNKYRKLVSTGFTPRRTALLEPKIRAAVDEILDAVEAKGTGEIDFVSEISARLPLYLIADLIGWPEEDRQRMFEWADRVARIDFHPEDAQLASIEFWGYTANLIGEIERGERPSPEGLLTVLMNAEVDGDRLSETEIVNFVLLLAIGGNETTRNCISGGLLALHEHPDQLAALRDDPLGLSASAVEEMLRWTSPITAFRRTATEDTELRGVPIREGDKVVLYYASGNRDEEVFAEPQRFDVTRDPNPHLSFGAGQHFCLGATLARMEIRFLYEELMRRFPDLTPTGEVERLDSNYVNAIDRLVVRTGR